jgi:hypothetical protein
VDVARSFPSRIRFAGNRNEEHDMTHVLDLLLNALVILVGLYLFSWLAVNPSSPLVGKV